MDQNESPAAVGAHRARASVRRRKAVMTLENILGLEARLPCATFAIAPGATGDIPEILRLLRTRRMPSGLPLKFARTPALLAANWPRVHWILAKRGGTLVGCLELRPLAGEPGAWEMGSFSQAADNGNPRVPVKLMVAGFRKLVELHAHRAVVEIHRQNREMWRFLSRLPFERDGEPASHHDFIRCSMVLHSSAP